MADSTTQLVFLDFDTFTDEGEIEYSPEQRSEILENIAADYALFDFSFTLIEPTEDDFSTLFFNAGPTGGLAEKIDFRNLDKNDTATININGLVAPPEVTVVGLSSFIGAHELGHLQGLRHGDSFAPIGSGLPSTGIPPNFAYLPEYPGPAGADETTRRLMASPASVGQEIPEADEDAFFSERSAVKLAFNEGGTVVSEEEENNSIATAQAIEFAPLDVPNTLLSGDNAGKDFLVEALVATGSVGTPGDEDFFSFEGKAGDLFQFEVLSDVLSFEVDPSAIAASSDSKENKSPEQATTDPFGSKGDKSPHNAIHDPFGSETIPLDALSSSEGGSPQIADSIDPQISIFDSSGNLVPYFSDVAFNDDEFESLDSILIDLELPEDNTYFIKVNDFSGGDTGEYELFGYKFQTIEDEDEDDDDLEEPNDTIPQAVDSELDLSSQRTFEASSFIGNNPNVTSTDDVDLIAFDLDAGDRVTIDIDAQVLGSSLDSVLRLFDSEGNQVAVNDDSGSLDSFINFTALASDTYFAGVSSFANFNYDPFLEGSGSGGSTGEYDITVNLFPGESDGELENGSFETGTFSDWQTIGDTSIKTADFGVTPTDGSFQALLTTGVSDSGGSVVDSDLEEFLDLAPGVLDGLGNGNVTEGSAVKQTFTADAGDILTFDWNFLTNEATPAGTLNDFAFFSLTPFTLELADTTSPIFTETLADGFNEETGFQTASVAISESGTFTLGFGIADAGDDVVDSGLLVDNIQVVQSEDGGGQVFEDPSGDTFGFGFPQLDIENVSGTVSGSELTLTMDFFTPIAAPSSGLAESVGGFWDLDLDQNPSTGIASNQSIFAPPDQQGGPLGVDVFIDLFSEQFQPGFVDLVDANFSIVGSAPISYDSDSLEIGIPLSLLGDDGNLNYGTVIGTFGEPTDAAPNDEFGIVGASLSSSLDTNTPVFNSDRIWEPLSQSEEFASKDLLQLSPSMGIGTADFAREDLFAMEDPLQLFPSMGIGTGLEPMIVS